MKKLLPFFLLFLSLLSLVSCTLTKRKYTGGFYVNWHTKAPEARVIAQAKTTYVSANKITETTVSPEHNKITQNTEKVVQTKKNEHSLTDISGNISTSFIPTSYIATPENPVSEKDSKNDNSGWKLAVAIICCILGVLGAIIVVGIIASAPFFSGASLPLAKGLSDALFPLILMFASLIFSDMATKNGHNRGLIACMILDCVFLLVLLFSVLSL